MKVYVDKIPPEGLELAGQLDPQAVSLELNTHGIAFTSTIEVKAKVTKAGGEVFADIDLEAPVEYVCGRCLARFTGVFKKGFKVNHEAKPGDIIEIDEDIRQEMILDYPMKSLCRPDCKGLCPNCGQNLNIDKCECRL